MDPEAAQRLIQRATLVGIAGELHAMFQQGTYWRDKYKQLYVHHDHTEEMEGHAAVWKTTIGINKDLQPFVEWFICFRRQPLGSLTIRYHDGALRTIIWRRATIGLWQLNTLWQEEPPLIELAEEA